MKNIIQKLVKQRSKILLVLITISLLMTSSTFAYWTEAVEGTKDNTAYSFNIGEYSVIESLFLLSSSTDKGSFTVNNKDYFERNYGYTHSFNEIFEAEWLYSSSWVSQYHIEGDIDFDYEIVITKQNGKEVNSKTYNRLIKYITVEFDEENDSKITLNEDPMQFGFTLHVTEPEKTNHYNQLDDYIITVNISYNISNIIYQYK